VILGADEFDYEPTANGGWEKAPLTLSEMGSPGDGSNFVTIITSVSTSLVAFAFSNTLFPTYSALRVKTNENMMKTSSLAITIVLFIYTFLSTVCLYLFGRGVNQGTDIMKCVNQELIHDSKRKEAFVL